MFVFHKSGVLLGVLVLLGSNLIFVINTTIPPKDVYDLHFLCHPPVSLCVSLSEAILLLVAMCVGWGEDKERDYCIEVFFFRK